jgi:hypothetical protein
MRGRNRLATGLSLILATAVLSAQPARATTSPETRTEAKAQAQAQVAKAKVSALLDRYQASETRVEAGVAALSAAFRAADDAEVNQATAQAQARRARAQQAADVRAVYTSGGPLTLTATVLDASSPSDALWRASTADRVLQTVLDQDHASVQTHADAAELAAHRAEAASAATDAQAHALESLQVAQTQAAQAVQEAQQTLTYIDQRARAAAAAVQRQIAAAQARARAASLSAMGTVAALSIPAEYEQAYRAAAATCPGLDWTLLAGVGQVESGHGRNDGPSSAGAVGPMQFMPSTFAAYAVDGDHNGILDAWNPQDAIFTAAHYLCVAGAEGGSAAGIHAALLTYNHAEWYVDLVLAAQQAIQRSDAG